MPKRKRVSHSRAPIGWRRARRDNFVPAELHREPHESGPRVRTSFSLSPAAIEIVSTLVKQGKFLNASHAAEDAIVLLGSVIERHEQRKQQEKVQVS